MPLLLPVSPAAVTEPDISQASDRKWAPFLNILGVGWLILIAICTAIGALLTGPLAGTALLKWDESVPQDLEDARTSTLTTLSHWGSYLGETVTVVAVAVLVGAVLLFTKRFVSVLLLATSLIVQSSVFVITQLFIQRDRPDVNRLEHGIPTSSFPSGHTAAATALALSLAIILGWHVKNRVVLAAAWAVAVLYGPTVAIARVYRGMHHPTDVLVSLALGVAAVVLALIALRAWVGERSPDRQSEVTYA